jgi:protein SCO1/2
VDFIFTRCPGPCPIMSAQMKELYEIYRDYQQVQFVSFTVDPEYDSLNVLQEYAENYGVDDDRWVFIWAEKPRIEKLYEEGFKLGGELPYNHSTKFVLVDQQGMIRGYYSTEDDISMSILRTHLRNLAKDAS